MAKASRGRLHRLAVAPTGMRSKLLWAFVLMSVVPLAMLLLMAAWFAFPSVRDFYHLERWFPLITIPQAANWWLFSLLVLTVVISLLGGVYLAVRIIEPVIDLSHEATQLAEGREVRELPVRHDDELGDLTRALNHLTSRIRTNMDELKQFGERTTQMNLEIHKRLVMLSGLLQIGELISQPAELGVILDLVVERLASLDAQGFSFLCLQPMEEFPVNLHRAQGIDLRDLKSVVFDTGQMVVDATHPPTELMTPMWEELKQPNLMVQPVLVRNRAVGILGIGNHHQAYAWSSEVMDLVAVFAKQLSLAIENELLLRKNKALAIHDELTGAYTDSYVRQRLAEEIKRAMTYRRPCALALFAIRDLAGYRQRRGQPEADRVLRKVVRLIQESITEIDRVGRLEGNEIAVLMPERNKRQAMELMEEICRRAAAAFSSASDPQGQPTLLGAVAENPLDGATAEELLTKASAALGGASTRPAGVAVAEQKG